MGAGAEIIPRSSIPPQAGTYILILHLASPIELRVGRLGASRFPAGWYGYVGSALGPGGLAARLGRHLRRHKRLHWHIDYLLAVAELTEIWWAVSPEQQECAWVRALSQLPGATVPLPGFGASDCHCPAHLLYFDHRPSFSALVSQLEGQCALHCTPLWQAQAVKGVGERPCNLAIGGKASIIIWPYLVDGEDTGGRGDST